MAKISIFGLAGTGKTTAGRLLAEKVSYRYISTGNMFRDKALSMGITLQELEKISNDNPNFDKDLDKQTEDFGKSNDDFVIESRLAWHFVPDSFKIKLDCDFDVRIGRIAKREGKDFEKVKSETMERESLIRERYKAYYGIQDFENDSNFDFIIDTTSIMPDEIVQNIINVLKEKNLLTN